MYAIIKEWKIEFLSFDEIEIKDWYSILKFEWVSDPFFDGEKIIEKPFSWDQISFQERSRVLKNLKTWSNDLEWYDFSDIEIGDIITDRVFWGNPYAQMVLQTKATEAMFRIMAGIGTPEDDAVIEKKTQVMTAVNQIRALFSLSPM